MKELGNKITEILLHTISYFFNDFDGDIDESGVEHIEYCIKEGYNQGELNITDPENPEEAYSGWWSIVS